MKIVKNMYWVMFSVVVQLIAVSVFMLVHRETKVAPADIVLVVPEPALNIPNAQVLYRKGYAQWDVAKHLQMLLKRATGVDSSLFPQ